MADHEYKPISHDRDAFLEKALKRKGFAQAYDALEEEYLFARELLGARVRAGLTQEEVARSMGSTKSAVSRLEGSGKHSPSVRTLKKYARAVGCDVEIRLVPAEDPAVGAKTRGESPRGTR